MGGGPVTLSAASLERPTTTRHPPPPRLICSNAHSRVKEGYPTSEKCVPAMAFKVGVLEPNQLETDIPVRKVNRSVAKYLLRKQYAYRISKFLIKMRDQVEEITHQIISWFTDGPLGVGNLLPFSKEKNYGDKLHYETAMAGDGNWVNGYSPRSEIQVSSRKFFNKQPIPAVPLTV